ncbi:MAG: hypothetical protein NVSMB9_08400 [Isosphaeraceae bacterium]
MSQTANVRSIEAIHDFKVALTNFAEEARNALGATEMEIRRAHDWLLRDQLVYWQAQIKRCNEQLSTARAELHRRKLSQQGSGAISDTEQKEAVKLAQRRLEEAEHKVAKIKRWAPILEHAIAEYHSTSQPLGDSLTGSVVNSLALLERMVVTLESYVAMVPSSTGQDTTRSLSPATSPLLASETPRSPVHDPEGESPGGAFEKESLPMSKVLDPSSLDSNETKENSSEEPHEERTR